MENKFDLPALVSSLELHPTPKPSSLVRGTDVKSYSWKCYGIIIVFILVILFIAFKIKPCNFFQKTNETFPDNFTLI